MYSQDELAEMMRQFAKTAAEARQIARRLVDLLPRRFTDLRKDWLGQGVSGAKLERLVLSDERYVNHLAELEQVRYQAVQARIQHETHRMLAEARQSLRARARR